MAASRKDLQFRSSGRLPWQQKCLRILPLAAEFERAEVFEPVSVGHLGLRFDPKSQSIQVIKADAALAHTLDEMLPAGGRHVRPACDLGIIHQTRIAPTDRPVA